MKGDSKEKRDVLDIQQVSTIHDELKSNESILLACRIHSTVPLAHTPYTFFHFCPPKSHFTHFF